MWSGPRLSAERQWDEKREQRRRLFRHVSRALSRGVGELWFGVRGWERSAHLARANPLPRFRSDRRAPSTHLFSRLEAELRTGWDEAGAVCRALAAATSRGAERRDSQSGEGPGSALPRGRAGEGGRQGALRREG